MCLKTSIKFWHKVCSGGKGKKYYAISSSFWDWVREQTNKIKKNEMTKMELAKKISKKSKGKIPIGTAYGWICYFFKDTKHSRKPVIIPDERILEHNDPTTGCIHGYKYFCPACKLNKKKVEGSPIPTVWRSHRRGKIYVFEGFWKDFINSSKRPEKLGILPSEVAEMFDLDSRVIRKWRTEWIKPEIYTKSEFSLNECNLYWLGLHLSDGHLRNNGSNLSFTWQFGSSNPF